MPTVLVVDDTPVDRRLAGGLIEALPQVTVNYAENGEAAMLAMQKSRPDLVVTDLQMPELDGLDLVTRIRMQYPDIPVILMTAQGSEEIAVEALRQGASGYVPKAHLSHSLTATVTEALAVANADRVGGDLLRCQQQLDFKYVLPNDPNLIDALVAMIRDTIEAMELTDHTGKFRFGVAVKEALLNSLYRGNLEISSEETHQFRTDDGEAKEAAIRQRAEQSPYRDRMIRVTGAIAKDQARIVVCDDGPGFDHQAALSGIGSLSQERGLVLMHSFVEELTFNNAGNEVTLIIRSSPQLSTSH